MELWQTGMPLDYVFIYLFDLRMMMDMMTLGYIYLIPETFDSRNFVIFFYCDIFPMYFYLW